MWGPCCCDDGRGKEVTLDIAPSDWIAEGDDKPFSVGDRVYYAAGRQQFDNGERLGFGTPGQVVSLWDVESWSKKTPEQPSHFTWNIGRGKSWGQLGRAFLTGAWSSAECENPDFVEVAMAGHSNSVCVRPSELSRRVPVMPPGWAVGEIVYYCGPEKRLSNTDTLTPGLKGEVVGRAARRGDGTDDQRVSVHFKGHKRNTPIITAALEKKMPSDAANAPQTWKVVRLPEEPGDDAPRYGMAGPFQRKPGKGAKK